MSNSISKEDLKLSVSIKGDDIPISDIEFKIIELVDTIDLKRDTLYNFSYDKWIFSINKKFINYGYISIVYDDRLVNNKIKTGYPRRGYFFKKNHFIYEYGGDNDFLLPVSKNKR